MWRLLTAGDGPEAFLAGSVPDLKLHPFVVNLDLLDLEVNPVTMQKREIKRIAYETH